MAQFFLRDKPILFREYGRSVQDMVESIRAEADRPKRTQLARTLIELMRMLNPQPGSETPEYYQKLWDHLHIMGEYELDVDSPFPLPAPEKAFAKPQPLKPPLTHVRFKNYGRNAELIVERFLAMEEGDERDGAIAFLGRLIKSFYAAYNKEIMDDNAISARIYELSAGKVKPNLERIVELGLSYNAPHAGSARAVHNFQIENQPSQPSQPRERDNRRQQNFRRGGPTGQGGGNQGGGGHKRRRY